VGEYLRTKGRNLATKADFDDLKVQLRENTELVENIKAEVGRKDWAAREWRNLRRTKLEEVLTKMHDCEEFADRHRHSSIDGKPSVERNPAGEMETLGVLYFPELKSELDLYLAAYRQHILFGSNLITELLSAGTDTAARKVPYAKYMSGFSDRHKASKEALANLNAGARLLLLEIAGPNQ
jgi:hypothetical protein